MNMIGEFAKRIIGELAQFIDWSLSHWADNRLWGAADEVQPLRLTLSAFVR